jgi:rod shape-determining protein MreC
MGFGSDRSLSRRDTGLFLLCVGLSIGALSAPRAWGEAVAATIQQTVLVPLLWLQERAEEAKTSRATVIKLSTERDSAAYAAQFLPALRAENQRLRQLLGLGQRLTVSFLPAEVLHQSLPTDGQTLVLSAGSKNGVQVFDPVISPFGLLGVIRTVGPDRSVAMTWAHPEFRASAYTEGGSVYGIVGATSEPSTGKLLLELRGVAYRDSIPEGMRVVTSGLGGVFPPGIPVGTVIGVAREEAGWERTYLVRPAANPASEEHVLILKAPHTGSVAGAFIEDSTR